MRRGGIKQRESCPAAAAASRLVSVAAGGCGERANRG